MRIIIVGVGKIGLTLAKTISAEGHDVVLVDKDESAIKTAHNTLDVIGITGNGATAPILESAGAARADILIATASTDELNILICLLAKKMGVQQTIARIRDPEYARDVYRMSADLGLSMILNPELLAAGEITRALKYPSAIKIENFARGKVSLVEFRIEDNNPLKGKKIMDIGGLLPVRVLVCAIVRGENVIIPRGNDTIEAGDIIYVTASKKQLYTFFKSVKSNTASLKNILILGCGKIGYYLAEELLDAGASVKIIEHDRERCNFIAGALPKTTVIYGDGTDHVLLSEEGIESMEGVVSLTGIDEENIIISLYAKSKKVDKVITKITRETLLGTVDNLGLESIVTPARIVADRVLGYIRALQASGDGSIITMYKLVEDKVEAIEFEVNEMPDLTGIPIMKRRLKKNLLIACVIRKNEIIFPSGSDTIEPKDRIIVVTANRSLNNLSDILA